jgi:hypothetical protein
VIDGLPAARAGRPVSPLKGEIHEQALCTAARGGNRQLLPGFAGRLREDQKQDLLNFSRSL